MSGSTLIIGVAGGSGSGKSTFIRQLQSQVDADSHALSMDEYYHDQQDVDRAARDLVNYDSLEAVDVELFVKHLDLLKQGDAVDTPKYDFSEHTRHSETRRLEPRPWLFLDGIMLLAVPEIRKRLDLSVFLDLDENTRFERRKDRDMQVRKRSEESVQRQWMETVEPFYQNVVRASASHADLVLQSQDFERVLHVLSRLG